MAQTDLKPGQLIFNELPMIVGPRQLTKPICLGCHKELKEVKYTCSRFVTLPLLSISFLYGRLLLFDRCGWPVCSKKCEDSQYHDLECRIMRAGGQKVNISKNMSISKDRVIFVYNVRTLGQGFLPL